MATNVGELTKQTEINARKELAYEWTAIYNDGTVLKQYDDVNLLVYNFGHIDQNKIKEFVIESTRNQNVKVSISLETGLFTINDKQVTKLILQDNSELPLGLNIIDKKVVSPWGNKAKLIYFRHITRRFVMGGATDVSMTYELGWEANVDGKSEKHTICVDEQGRFILPRTPEQEGFKAL